MRNKRSSKGFTLTELVVVMGIIAVIMAIMVPQLTKYRNRGYRAACINDCKNAITAGMNWYTANSDTASSPTLNDLRSFGFASSPNVVAAIIDGSLANFTIQCTHVSGGQSVTMLVDGSYTSSN
ncbi:MAG: prepilin-type N-terminal cleavage/methylation domain-containing protein [Deltaproteobacteria bacterium]|nr:prepilin-type N-terminal cleavage/methylation domain-containing protein [Deltaproteobacteria bacterium]